ncbi:MAG: hypothetical protein IJW86_02920 [Clostridia bacterium]|nr:hypothetical protein [Clostridia bacterium]
MKKKIAIVVCVIIILLSVSMGITDYFRARGDERPGFAVKTATLKDGGTKIYYGLGYKVISYNQLPDPVSGENRDDTVFGSWLLKYEN